MEKAEMKEPLPVRRNNRLPRFDYSQNGAYFLTICTQDRKNLLSHIVGGGVLDAPQVQLTKFGYVVDRTIQSMNEAYPDVQTEKYVIMPNHVHLLVRISRDFREKESGPSRTPAPTNAVIPQYISTLKRLCNRVFGENIWQRSYHDHIIRTERDYRMIWQYINTNPMRWEQDCFYTED